MRIDIPLNSHVPILSADAQLLRPVFRAALNIMSNIRLRSRIDRQYLLHKHFRENMLAIGGGWRYKIPSNPTQWFHFQAAGIRWE